MLLTLDDGHREDLEFLKEVSIEVVREFCRISIEFIKNGTNPKMYSSAAQKLSVEPAVVQSCVQGLMYLLTEAARLNLRHTDFQDSIVAMGFPQETSAEILSQYIASQSELRRVLCEMAPGLPHYHNLQWRLDVQLASRSLHHQVEPQVLLKIHTKDTSSITKDASNTSETTDQVLTLQADPANLVHLTRTLEDALREVKSAHCRRILRNI